MVVETPEILIDTKMYEDCTLGRLFYKDFQCYTLELPWLDNLKKVSCVPAGTYSAKKYTSAKHGCVILLDNVPNRSFIEVHAGNYTSQIQGCCLVGDGIKHVNADSIPDVTNSKATLTRLMSMLPDVFDVTFVRC
jgi:hypothetical protein